MEEKTELITQINPTGLDIFSIFGPSLSGTVLTVLFVMIIDKTFYSNKLDSSSNEKRSWHLPLICLGVGTFVYASIQNSLNLLKFDELISISKIYGLLFEGLKSSALVTVGYKIFKKAIYNKVKSITSEPESSESEQIKENKEEESA